MRLQNKAVEFIYKIVTGNRRKRIFFTFLGAISYYSMVFLIVIVSLQIDTVLHFPKILYSPLNFVISAPLIVLGLFLSLWSVLNFAKVKGTPVPFNPPLKLIAAGPYARVRNPMLTGLFIILFGLGFLLKSTSLVFIFTPLFIIMTIIEIKLIEEPELEKRLGDQYREYKKRVPMFIPKL